LPCRKQFEMRFLPNCSHVGGLCVCAFSVSSAVQNEFHGCQADLRLCRDIAKCVVGALKTFVNRVEGIVVTNPFATHIADHFQRTGAQRHNHALVARLAQVDRALDDFCAAQEPAVASVLSQSFTPAHDAIRAQIANVVVSSCYGYNGRSWLIACFPLRAGCRTLTLLHLRTNLSRCCSRCTNSRECFTRSRVSGFVMNSVVHWQLHCGRCVA
jgi:hypothetical protein